ncbi:MAG: UDP-N-acetylmuramoyl-L-alanine--D-glutamate ligase [Leptospirillia bacterium]
MFGFFKKNKRPDPERRGIPEGTRKPPDPAPSSSGHGRPAGTPPTQATASSKAEVIPDATRIPLAGARVTVFGLGASGAAAARLLARENARVTVADERPEATPPPDRPLPDGCTVAYGEVSDALENADLIVLSPGVPRAHPALLAAEASRVPVIGEVELAARHLDPATTVIGITGTNGKSTVTALAGHILSGWKARVFTGGNLGEPLSSAALAQETDGPWDLVVAELSSFQLEGTTSFAPDIGVLLNTAPDHLDRYPNLSAYYAAKFHLFAFMQQGYALLNAGDDSTATVTEHYLSGAAPVLFGVDPDASDGVGIKDGVISVTTGGETHPIVAVSELSISGNHNVENAQAAAAICLLAGCPIPIIAERIVSFTGLPHRMQTVAEADGITWIDDSKATNPGAVVKALTGMDAPLTLLLGGRDKGGDLATLREPVFLHARRVIAFGEAAEIFRLVLRGFPELTVVETLAEAVNAARTGATAGEVVLLSPACASFDEFSSYAERGDAFRKYAMEAA